MCDDSNLHFRQMTMVITTLLLVGVVYCGCAQSTLTAIHYDILLTGGKTISIVQEQWTVTVTLRRPTFPQEIKQNVQ